MAGGSGAQASLEARWNRGTVGSMQPLGTLATAGATLAAASLLLLACSEDGSQGSPDWRADRLAEASQDLADGAQPPDEDAAEDLVRNFYDNIDLNDFATAWKIAPDALHEQAGTLDEWRRSYRSTVRTRAHGVNVLEVSPDGRIAAVEVEVTAVDRDVCSGQRVPQEFYGTWVLRSNGARWKAVDLSVAKVAGDTPRLVRAECPPIRRPRPRPFIGIDPDPSPPIDPIGTPNDPYDTPYPDKDCDDFYTDDIYVGPNDPYGLDADGDGIGCESP